MLASREELVPDRERFADHGGEACDLSLGAILDDEALPLAGASQLRLDRHDDGIEIGPLALSPLQRRADLRLAQADSYGPRRLPAFFRACSDDV